MNGVEILSSQTIYDTVLPAWLGVIGFIMLIVIFVLYVAFEVEFETDGTIIYTILVLASILLMVLSLVSGETDINRIEYKVTIDDSVSMNEFLDKYEIIDQEGKIYTVKEKINEDK